MVSRISAKKNDKARNTNQRGKNNRPSPAPARPSSAAPIAGATSVAPLLTSATPPNLVTVQDAMGQVRTLKKWCFDRTPVYLAPNELRHATYLNKGTIVELTGQKQSTFSSNVSTSWTQVAYRTFDSRAGLQWVTAWVNDAYLDDYNERFPYSGVPILNATPNPNDAQQYMNLEGKTRFNMCGPLCLAFLAGDGIDSFLEKWKSHSLGSFNKMLGGGRDNTTSEADLKTIFTAIKDEYGFRAEADQVVSFRERLTIPVSSASMAEDLERMLVTHSLVVLVTINRAGHLIGTRETPQISHWIVVDKITHGGNRVEIYNPFPNRREEFSFHEFFRSCRAPWSGIWVKRKNLHRALNFTVESLPRFEVTIEKPNPAYKAAQYIDIDGKKKTNLCGQFCVSFIVKDSIENVLERWKVVQPRLYASSVGINEGTGPFDLETILRMYGYNNDGDLVNFVKGLTDPHLKKYLHSPGRIARMLEEYFLIAGVNIDGTTGKLKPGNEVRHWVVVNKISPAENHGGWVELYNPFQNCREEYSYREFERSVGTNWDGLWVKRNIVPKEVKQQVADPVDDAGQVHSHNPERPARPGRWTEFQVLAAYRQQSKNGVLVNKIAANLAEKSGWKRQEILELIKNSTRGTQGGRWADTRLSTEIRKRQAINQPAHKIAAELAETSGWKRQEILTFIRQLIRAGGGERWSEEQLLTAINEQLKLTQSPHRIAAALIGDSGWKNWEIVRLLKSMRRTEEMDREESGIRVMEEEPPKAVDPQTIVQASKPWAEFRAWQDALLAQPGSNLRRVRRWGDEVMIRHGFDVNQVNTTNFQAVGLYNDGNKQFGAISNFLRIPHENVMQLKAMQIEDEYEDKKEDWRSQKMNWLCKPSGTIYFFESEAGGWQAAPQIHWGTLALGGNLVQVEGTEIIRTKLRDREIVDVEMARLKGFQASDWDRPLDELLAEGLVHRCFCAYRQNHFGDTPKGIVYSPFYSPLDWDFSGNEQPTAFYIPLEWLEPKA